MQQGLRGQRMGKALYSFFPLATCKTHRVCDRLLGVLKMVHLDFRLQGEVDNHRLLTSTPGAFASKGGQVL